MKAQVACAIVALLLHAGCAGTRRLEANRPFEIEPQAHPTRLDEQAEAAVAEALARDARGGAPEEAIAPVASLPRLACAQARAGRRVALCMPRLEGDAISGGAWAAFARPQAWIALWNAYAAPQHDKAPAPSRGLTARALQGWEADGQALPALACAYGRFGDREGAYRVSRRADPERLVWADLRAAACLGDLDAATAAAERLPLPERGSIGAFGYISALNELLFRVEQAGRADLAARLQSRREAMATP